MQYPNKDTKDQGNSLQHPCEIAAGVHFSCMGSPYKVDQIEMWQLRAARWTCSNFDWNASVTEILNNLGWRSLE